MFCYTSCALIIIQTCTVMQMTSVHVRCVLANIVIETYLRFRNDTTISCVELRVKTTPYMSSLCRHNPYRDGFQFSDAQALVASAQKAVKEVKSAEHLLKPAATSTPAAAATAGQQLLKPPATSGSANSKVNNLLSRFRRSDRTSDTSATATRGKGQSCVCCSYVCSTAFLLTLYQVALS